MGRAVFARTLACAGVACEVVWQNWPAFGASQLRRGSLRPKAGLPGRSSPRRAASRRGAKAGSIGPPSLRCSFGGAAFARRLACPAEAPRGERQAGGERRLAALARLRCVAASAGQPSPEGWLARPKLPEESGKPEGSEGWQHWPAFAALQLRRGSLRPKAGLPGRSSPRRAASRRGAKAGSIGPPSLRCSFGGAAFARRLACPAEAPRGERQAGGERRLASPPGFEPGSRP